MAQSVPGNSSSVSQAGRAEPAVCDRLTGLRSLSTRRWRLAMAMTIAMVVIYFGFIALVAFGRGVLAALSTWRETRR